MYQALPRAQDVDSKSLSSLSLEQSLPAMFASRALATRASLCLPRSALRDPSAPRLTAQAAHLPLRSAQRARCSAPSKGLLLWCSTFGAPPALSGHDECAAERQQRLLSGVHGSRGRHGGRHSGRRRQAEGDLQRQGEFVRPRALHDRWHGRWRTVLGLWCPRRSY